ncbi:hypothetical protein D3C86_1357880 [compost metagenome]
MLAGQQRLGVVAQIDDHAVAGSLLHRAGDDLADALAIGIDHLGALGLADLLHDHLFGGLRRDATEFDGVDLFLDHVTQLGVSLLLLRLGEGQLGRRILQVVFVDHGPAAEGFIITSLTIDRNTQFDLVLETLFGGSGQSQLQRFENHAGRYALFIGHRLYYQQYFFAHRTPRLSQSIGTRRIRASVKTGNDVGLVDRIDRQQVFMLVYLNDHILLFHATQQALEIASSLVGRAQPDLHLLAHVGSELLEGKQRAIHPGRRNLQGVLTADRILDIQHATDLPTDFFAVFDQNAVGKIDIDPQQGMPALRNEFDAPALVAESLDHRGQQGLQLF